MVLLRCIQFTTTIVGSRDCQSESMSAPFVRYGHFSDNLLGVTNFLQKLRLKVRVF